MKPEYDIRGGVRGKYSQRYRVWHSILPIASEEEQEQRHEAVYWGWIIVSILIVLVFWWL